MVTELDRTGISTDTKYPVEFIANGEQQIVSKLTPEQINKVTNLIIDMQEGLN